LSRHLSQYFFDQSGGRMTCNFTVFEWMQLSITGQQWNDAGPAVGDTARAEAAAHHHFNQADFDRYVLVIDEQVGSLGVTDYTRASSSICNGPSASRIRSIRTSPSIRSRKASCSCVS
jgi:hypothetical protein